MNLEITYSSRNSKTYWFRNNKRISEKEAREFLESRFLKEWFQNSGLWISSGLFHNGVSGETNLKVGPVMRIRNKKRPWTFRPIQQGLGYKPHGLWFSRGSWLWYQHEDMTIANLIDHYHDSPMLVVSAEPQRSPYLFVNNDEEFLEFNQKYAVEPSEETLAFARRMGGSALTSTDYSRIDWERVSKDYPGVAFTKNRYVDGKYQWHNSWEVESLVIWTDIPVWVVKLI